VFETGIIDFIHNSVVRETFDPVLYKENRKPVHITYSIYHSHMFLIVCSGFINASLFCTVHPNPIYNNRKV
jgi:hypothetical protein